MSEKLVLILTVAFIIFGAGLALLDKVYDGSASKRQKTIAWSVFMLVLFSAIVTYCSGNKSIKEKIISDKKQDSTSKKNDSLTKSLINLSKTNVELSKKQLDSALTLIALSRELIDTQQRLNSFQEYSLNQITGGDNKPLLNIGITIGIDSISPKKDIRFSIQPNITLHNLGNTNLRKVEGFIEDIYKDIKIIENETDSSFVYNRGDTAVYYNHYPGIIFVENFFPNNAYISEYSRKRIPYDVGLIKPKNSKTIYKTNLPKNAIVFSYTINVEWDNGSYIAKIYGKYDIKKMTYHIRNIDYYDNNNKIADQFKYFGRDKIKYPKELILCPSITYRKEKYNVLWSKRTKVIAVQRVGSLYVYPYEMVANSEEEASKLVLAKLEEVFGK